MTTFDAVKFFGALFAIMNPLTNLPVFLSATDGMEPGQRRSTAIQVALYCGVLGGVFALVGDALLKAFGIDVNDFRVAGGLVVLLIGLGMLNGHDSSAHHGTTKEQGNFQASDAVAFYPLTFPILVGPGTITTLILYRQQAQGTTELMQYGLVFGAILAMLLVVFLCANFIGKHLGQTARVIMTRLMGMILAAIAVEMIAEGLKALFPALAGT